MNPPPLEPPLESPNAEYDRWFHAKVQAALDDPRPAYGPQEWAIIKADRLARIKARQVATKTT